MSGKNTSKRIELKMLYGSRCMLTMVEENLTLHHLEKVEHGGPTTVENGSVLYDKIHAWLTDQEHKDPEIYDLVNECLILYKKCMDENLNDLVQMFREECVPEFQKKIGIEEPKCLSLRKIKNRV